VGTFSSTAIEIIKWVNFFAVAKVCLDVEVGLSLHTLVCRRCPGSDLKVKIVESEGVPHLEAWEYRIQ
jgi:hypothetical protein